jgi:chromosome segregation ATPase
MATSQSLDMARIEHMLKKMTIKIDENSSQNEESNSQMFKELSGKIDNTDSEIKDVKNEVKGNNQKLINDVNNKIEQTNKYLSSEMKQINENLTRQIEQSSKDTAFKLVEEINNSASKLDSKIDESNLKFDKHTEEVKATIEEFKKQVNTNFRRQDEKLNKFRIEFHERLEQKVTLINQQFSEVTAEIKTQTLLNKEEIQNTKEECTKIGENIKEVKKQVESKADRDEVYQKLEQQLKVMREDLTKAMKSQQAKVVRCGSYKEEPDNLIFSGNPEENPVEFLRLFEAYVTRVNPLMDDEDKKDMLNRFLKSWAGTWWKVISDLVRTYADFKEKYLAQYWNVQIQRMRVIIWNLVVIAHP